MIGAHSDFRVPGVKFIKALASSLEVALSESNFRNMKYSLVVFFLLQFSLASSQPRIKAWLDSAKAEFKRDFAEQDYGRAKNYLDSLLNVQPDHAEAHYYLGYAYSRLNSKDGNEMHQMLRSGTERCSAEFEKVIRLQPHYSGEIVVLDPYSKITAEWASLAGAYERRNQKDSMLWAFAEGKKRGGFSDYFLALCRQTLDACIKNAILISSGDMYTFPLWYLQKYEFYRKDVALVDISLLNATWYPAFLETNKTVDFGFPAITRDTLEYCWWETQWVKAGKLSWKLPAMYYEHYLLRGDRLLLNLLKTNAFKREVFFTVAFPPESQLNVNTFLSSGLLLDQLTPGKSVPLSSELFYQRMSNCLGLIAKHNRNSDDERRTIDNFRYDVFIRAASYEEQKNWKDRDALILLYQQLASSTLLPFLTDEGLKYEAEMLKQR